MKDLRQKVEEKRLRQSGGDIADRMGKALAGLEQAVTELEKRYPVSNRTGNPEFSKLFRPPLGAIGGDGNLRKLIGGDGALLKMLVGGDGILPESMFRLADVLDEMDQSVAKLEKMSSYTARPSRPRDHD